MSENGQEYVNRMIKERGYILDFHKVLAAEDMDFLKAYNEMVAGSYTNPRALDKKTKELIYCVMLTCVKASIDQIKLHVRGALNAGATKTEVLQALELTITAAGVPAFMIGFEAWKQVTGPNKFEPKT
jgi:4-carboxymuconolactone decarboxylase